MIEAVLETIKKNEMFDRGDKVIVAVSGGPDSIALLHILYRLKEQLNIMLCAAHVNHCLRGEESDGDEQYVKDFCDNLGVEFKSRRIDIDEISKMKNISHESAGREARYEFFEKLREEIGADKIAIAHNSNDQAETILMRIMRGTGAEGLIGIRPVRNNIFVRPLINSTRNEIENYCKKNELRPRIDKTNLEAIYTRNKIRLELIPYIQENFNNDIIQGLNRFSNIIRIDNDYIESVSREKYKKYCDITSERVIISKEAFLEHEAIITRIIRLALQEFIGNLYNFERIHIYDIFNIQKHTTGKKVILPNNLYAINNYGYIHIYRNKKQNIKSDNKEYILHKGVNELEEIKLKVDMELVDNNGKINIKTERLVKYFDYDKIKNNITLRYRKEGDKFAPLGMKGNKKLKDFFIDLKILKEQRDNIPLICFDDEIAWVVGYRVSETFKINKDTQNIIKISFESEEQ